MQSPQSPGRTGTVWQHLQGRQGSGVLVYPVAEAPAADVLINDAYLWSLQACPEDLDYEGTVLNGAWYKMFRQEQKTHK
eukprot:scaffold572432_cov37-Prasinocladus_malaysianus.AAC.1